MHLHPFVCSWACWSENEVCSGTLSARCDFEATEIDCAIDQLKPGLKSTCVHSAYYTPTRFHAKACNRHAGPLEDVCECHALPLLGVKMSHMYEAGVTTGEPAGAIISPMTTTAHGPKTSDKVH